MVRELHASIALIRVVDMYVTDTRVDLLRCGVTMHDVMHDGHELSARHVM